MLVRRHRDVPAFVQSLHLHYSVRLHAALLLVCATACGLLLSKILLMGGMQAPEFRFPVAVVSAYFLFLLFVHWWLMWIGIKSWRERDWDGSIPDATDFTFGGGGGSTPSPEPFTGGGGGFDGGGASAGFEVKAQAVQVGVETKAQAAGSTLEGIASVGSLSELGFIFLVIVAIVAALGASGWIISATPQILVETAIDVAVASGLIRSLSRKPGEHWFDSLFSRTVWKAVILAILALLIGVIVRMVDPSANTIGQMAAHFQHH